MKIQSPWIYALLLFPVACGGADNGSSLEAPEPSIEADTTSCPSFAGTLDQQVAAGRATVAKLNFIIFTFSTYSAVGTNEFLGSSGTQSVTLYPASNGYTANASLCVPTGGGGYNANDRPACISDSASQVGIVGDSYITGFFTPALQPYLTQLQPNAFQAAPNNAGAGCSMNSGGICLGMGNVPVQLNALLQAHPNVQFLLMDGGGNDVLICDGVKYPNCSNLCRNTGSSLQPVCQQLVSDSLSAAAQLFTSAAVRNSKIRDVIYYFYPHVQPGGGFSGPNSNEMLDYTEPKARALCDAAVTATNGKIRCHFVDTVQPIQAAFGQNWGAYLSGLDGVHPLDSAQKVISKTISDRMKADCLGQPASSGCCAP